MREPSDLIGSCQINNREKIFTLRSDVLVCELLNVNYLLITCLNGHKPAKASKIVLFAKK